MGVSTDEIAALDHRRPQLLELAEHELDDLLRQRGMVEPPAAARRDRLELGVGVRLADADRRAQEAAGAQLRRMPRELVGFLDAEVRLAVREHHDAIAQAGGAGCAACFSITSATQAQPCSQPAPRSVDEPASSRSIAAAAAARPAASCRRPSTWTWTRESNDTTDSRSAAPRFAARRRAASFAAAIGSPAIEPEASITSARLSGALGRCAWRPSVGRRRRGDLGDEEAHRLSLAADERAVEAGDEPEPGASRLESWVTGVIGIVELGHLRFPFMRR